MVLETVSSLGSALRTFSYSAMAFCSLPCWTNFSAALRAFCLLKPKPNAIRLLTPAPGLPPVRKHLPWRRSTDGLAIRSAMSADQTRDGLSDKGHCKAGYQESYGYQGLPKGSVRTSYDRNRVKLTSVLLQDGGESKTDGIAGECAASQFP